MTPYERNTAMIELSKLSRRYEVRRMCDADADDILNLCRQNEQYYQYCGKEPSIELVLHDLHTAPPDISSSDKYYIGFYDSDTMIAVMDLIDGYPAREYAYIGFFMMNKALQGRQIGSEIIRETCCYLKTAGFSAAELAIDKGNPQSTHFWKKNGFGVVKEVEQDGGTLLVAERTLI
jgi:RimJ/RimL family protein N-acetyltransferase